MNAMIVRTVIGKANNKKYYRNYSAQWDHLQHRLVCYRPGAIGAGHSYTNGEATSPSEATAYPDFCAIRLSLALNSTRAAICSRK